MTPCHCRPIASRHGGSSFPRRDRTIPSRCVKPDHGVYYGVGLISRGETIRPNGLPACPQEGHALQFNPLSTRSILVFPKRARDPFPLPPARRPPPVFTSSTARPHGLGSTSADQLRHGARRCSRVRHYPPAGSACACHQGRGRLHPPAAPDGAGACGWTRSRAMAQRRATASWIAIAVRTSSRIRRIRREWAFILTLKG